MIIELKQSVSEDKAENLAKEIKGFLVATHGKRVIVTTSAMKQLDGKYDEHVEKATAFDTDIQLSSREFLDTKRKIQIGNVTIGGDTKNCMMIAGPCSVESEEQITQSAELMKELGVQTLRAGCYKPRTSPYSFQGLGLEGLKLLAKMREKFGMNIITEVRDATHIEEIIEYSDIIQIGAKAMYDQGILRRCAKTRKPVLIKRGFGSTLQEFVQTAEFILSGGNDNVMFCERGIRTFETKTRFTLDLCSVAYLKEYTNIPVILDPSHAMGFAYGVPDLARACAAMGVDGLLIEVHPTPKLAKSDAAQQLDHDEFRKLYGTIETVNSAIGQNLV